MNFEITNRENLQKAKEKMIEKLINEIKVKLIDEFIAKPVDELSQEMQILTEKYGVNIEEIKDDLTKEKEIVNDEENQICKIANE